MNRIVIILLSAILLSGCAVQAIQTRDNRSSSSSSSGSSRPMTPRENAARQLAQEGIHHLSTGNPDNAIRSFEKAIGLNPNNGQCYYYMAQAWLAKGSASEAREFNNLARDYLADDERWQSRIRKQSARIQRLSK